MTRSDPMAGVRTILVPVDGSAASMAAVRMASEIAKKSRGKVYAVNVVEVKRYHRLDAELTDEAEIGENILTRAEKIAQDAGFEIEGELLHARDVGHAIVDEAVDRGVDLIFLGTDHKAPFGENQLGPVTQYVLRAAPCDVWIWRHSVKA